MSRVRLLPAYTAFAVILGMVACEAPILSVPGVDPAPTTTASTTTSTTTTTKPSTPNASATTTAPAAPATSGAAPAPTGPAWTIDLTTIPADSPAARGKLLAEKTDSLLPEHVGNGLRCTNCHLKSGTEPGAAAWVGVTWRYPKMRARTGKEVDLQDRINDCFQRSMNGKALPRDSEPMLEMVAYMHFLDEQVPKDDVAHAAVDAAAPIAKLKLDHQPDATKGKAVYEARCQACHGVDGAGMKGPDGAYVFPAVGGDRTYNIAAGMARHFTASGFIKHNMPLGQGNSLTDEEAWDVAEYVIHLPRPDYPEKAKDWPNGGKPEDARY